jgi:multicomponent K+:H+ antiporter subunit C
VLTAIVIAFGMTAFVIALALKARSELGSDHVDGLDFSDDEHAAEQHQSQQDDQSGAAS